MKFDFFKPFVRSEVVPGEFYFIAPNTPADKVQELFEQGLAKFVAYEVDGRLVIERAQSVKPIVLTTHSQVGILFPIPGNEWMPGDEINRTIATTKSLSREEIEQVLLQIGRLVKSVGSEPIESFFRASLHSLVTTKSERASFAGQPFGRKSEMQEPASSLRREVALQS